MKKFIKNYWPALVPIVVLIVAILFLIKNPDNNDDNKMIGMVEAEFVNISPELPGMLDSLHVNVGDTVKKGQLLAIMRSKEIGSFKDQSKLAIEAAKNQLELIKKGARPEILGISQNLYKIAQQEYDLAQKTYNRINELYKNQVVSGEEKDMINFRYMASKEQLESAKLNLEMLQNGSQPELIKQAEILVEQAEQSYFLTSTLNDNAKITSPADGIISSVVVHEGEFLSIGYPIITLLKEGSYFIKFNIRQDKINGIEVGKKFSIKIPGCKPEVFDGEVTNIAPALEFADWVPTKESGKFELRTFDISVKPVNIKYVNGFRPGMTAQITLQ